VALYNFKKKWLLIDKISDIMNIEYSDVESCDEPGLVAGTITKAHRITYRDTFI
jgi:hypothetical protein